MIAAQLARVRPRVVSPESGETRLLEEVVAEQLSRSNIRAIQILGGPASGKSTALAHLAATLRYSSDIILLDNPASSEVAFVASARRVICAQQASLGSTVQVVLPLVPWGKDELIEYLQTTAPDQCADVLSRIRSSPERDSLQGNAALWALVLDEMRVDTSITDVRNAVQCGLASAFPTREQLELAACHCIAMLLGNEAEAQRTISFLNLDALSRLSAPLLRLPLVQRLLAAQYIVASLMIDDCLILSRALPRPLVHEIGRLLNSEPEAIHRLEAMFTGMWRACQPQAATILFAANRHWRPPDPCTSSLCGGSFPSAAWANINLSVAPQGPHDLSKIELSGADLRCAALRGARLREARLVNAHLDKASLVGVHACWANLSGASLVAAEADRIDLSNANLQRAVFDDASLIGARFDGADLRRVRFRNANLIYSTLLGCDIENADFTNANLQGCHLGGLPLRRANLEGACFREAELSHCDLEGVRLFASDFLKAKLVGTLLTATAIPDGDFQEADLRQAKLADIDWENADLRGADLRGCTFHLGSTRSGLVGSPYPGHGSKTGFYTDDYFDQHFKNPEQIRKANLRGADLRGAKLDGVDFYLVDLRDARLDADAEQHLEKCGAILYDHCA
jgi:uncharacterized protein YjbI with pentapeptide repeats